MSSQVWWYATRGAGLMTWAMSTMSILLGLLMSSKALGKRPGFPWLLDLHRFASGLSFGFLGAHLVTLWADSYVEFGWAELFLPFSSSWKPGAVAWGIVAMYLMAAIELSSLIKSRLPERWWHGVHLTSYIVFVFGTVHSWQAGTDVRNPLILAIGLAGIALVVGLTGLRIAVARGAISVARPRDRSSMLAEARRRASAKPHGGEQVETQAASPASKWLEASQRR